MKLSLIPALLVATIALVAPLTAPEARPSRTVPDVQECEPKCETVTRQCGTKICTDMICTMCPYVI